MRRDLPLRPSIAVETSPGKHHYIYVCRGLDWELWHGVQQTLISEYGSDPQAGSRTQVLRLPGTLHQKDPAKPHLVRIVEELSSWQVYYGSGNSRSLSPAAYIEGSAPPSKQRSCARLRLGT